MTGNNQKDESSAGAIALVWEELVLAALAVYQFPLERVLPLRDKLRLVGLLDLHSIAKAGEATVTRELNAAGYSRGLLTGLYAERLVKLARTVLATDEAGIAASLAGAPAHEIENRLLLLPGVGPKVIQNVLELRNRRRQPTC